MIAENDGRISFHYDYNKSYEKLLLNSCTYRCNIINSVEIDDFNLYGFVSLDVMVCKGKLLI